MILTLLSFLVILMVLILAHELGHFVTAKIFGVTVEEFGLGFPPRLVSFEKGGTRYSLNIIPLGGFVKLAGEEDPNISNSLASKSIGTRLLVLSAGSIMNLILPLLLFSTAFMIPHDVLIGDVVIGEVDPDSPAAGANITAGDIILSINEKTINNTIDLHRYIQLNLGKEMNILVKHIDSTTDDVKVIPRWKPPEGRGAVGIVVTTANPAVVRQSEPFWKAIPSGITECIDTFILFKNGIIGMIIGSAPVEIAGPVGIAQITGEVVKAGISPLLEFAAFLSINLGIINLFPLPALDGGRIIFVLLEGIRRGKRISPRAEGLVHAIGFALLMAAFLAITYQDIARIISGDSLIP
ncbi:MAG: RIP metalloprotease RseP [Dehalococcoidales bacterium]|nr:RIP metalloprotease RseP [Dehalococcoidales bacterium]